jgi:hypothetical protein
VGEVGCGTQGRGELGIEQAPGLVGFLEFFTQSLQGGLEKMRWLQGTEARCDPGGCSPSGIFAWRVARGFVEHLIAYGLGRPFGFTDEDLANEILTTANGKYYSVSEFVQALVQSKAFHTK